MASMPKDTKTLVRKDFHICMLITVLSTIISLETTQASINILVDQENYSAFYTMEYYLTLSKEWNKKKEWNHTNSALSIDLESIIAKEWC